MDYPLYLLESHQPTLWPKWEIGVSADDLPTEELHMFLFEPAEFDGLGRAVAACQFMDGADWVARTPSELPAQSIETSQRHLCHDCMEVSLQFVLRQDADNLC